MFITEVLAFTYMPATVETIDSASDCARVLCCCNQLGDLVAPRRRDEPGVIVDFQYADTTKFSPYRNQSL